LNTRLASAALFCLCAVPAVRAETLYVIEQLYVTVNTQADGSGERVGQIKSGDRVEVLERQDDQAHVQLASGEEGWVKASYLSADPPLRQQLATRTEELEKLRKEKAQLETDLASAKTAATAAQASANAAIKAANSASTAPGAAKSAPVQSAPTPAASAPAAVDANATSASEAAAQSAPPMFEETPMMPARPSWLLALGSAGIALVVGFALGWRMLDRRIRAKYGGLRIY
jgi:SH3 domain protein